VCEDVADQLFGSGSVNVLVVSTRHHVLAIDLIWQEGLETRVRLLTVAIQGVCSSHPNNVVKVLLHVQCYAMAVPQSGRLLG
jgi:hypothetical protein